MASEIFETDKHILPFYGFVPSTPVLPTLYWDVYSDEQRTKEMCKMLKKMTDYLEYMSDEENITRDMINELIEEYHHFTEISGFDYYSETLQRLYTEFLVIETILPIDSFNENETVRAFIDNLQAQINEAANLLQSQLDEYRPLTRVEVAEIVNTYRG